MRKSKKKVFIFILLVIFISIVLFLGNSYSKYITQINGKGVIEVAKWAFLVNGQTASITNLNLLNTYNPNTLVSNKIAPGTNGSFDIVVDASGSEVGIDYKVKFENEINKPNNLQFIYDGNVVNSVKQLEQFLQGNIGANTEHKVKTMTIEWQWKYETGSNAEQIASQDAQDTNDGKSLSRYQFDIIVTGTQVEPTV